MKNILARIFHRKTEKTRYDLAPNPVRARYDSAQTTPENAAHWGMATAWDADREANPQVRQIIRNRARYEAANSSWLGGMVRCLANDVIGTGPHLQILTESEDINNRIEADFTRWSRRIRLAKKLRTARKARARDGEAFLLLIQNPALRDPVKLDVMPIEADRVCNPLYTLDSDHNIDGVIVDDCGNPIAYEILKYHPGGQYAVLAGYEHITVPARYVIHLYDADRPEQHRGISELAAALPDCATLRRYTRAMVKKMETSANISGVIESSAGIDDGDDEDSDDVAAFQPFALPKDAFVALPKAWTLKSHNVQNPIESQTNFADQIKSDSGRTLQLPRNVALGNSSSYNYASGRLDYQEYEKALAVEHDDLALDALDPILEQWLAEYLLLPENYVQSLVVSATSVPHTWYWDGREHVDPAKEASAATTDLANGTTTLAVLAAKRGRDWRTVIDQRLDEEAYIMQGRQKRGLPLNESAPTPSNQNQDPEPDRDQEEENNADQDHSR